MKGAFYTSKRCKFFFVNEFLRIMWINFCHSSESRCKIRYCLCFNVWWRSNGPKSQHISTEIWSLVDDVNAEILFLWWNRDNFSSSPFHWITSCASHWYEICLVFGWLKRYVFAVQPQRNCTSLFHVSRIIFYLQYNRRSGILRSHFCLNLLFFMLWSILWY